MPTFSGSMVSAKARDIVTSALREIMVIAPGETPSAEEGAQGLESLQRIIDQWNAIRERIFSLSFLLFNLQANHAPHTIGPTGDFNAAYRPFEIFSASFVLNGSGSNPVDTPIKIRDDDWWAANPLKSMTNAIVTDLYYDPALPNGNLNFWPISTIVAPVRLEVPDSLTQAVSLDTSLALAQGYWEGLILELAMNLCEPFEKTPSAMLMMRWNRAMRIIDRNNTAPPRIETSSGMPGSDATGRPDFNFLTGLRE